MSSLGERGNVLLCFYRRRIKIGTIWVNFIEDLVMPNGLQMNRLRSDREGEYYRSLVVCVGIATRPE